MRDVAEQWWTLAGVLLGGSLSVIGGAVAERSRWKREHHVRWDQRSLDAYVQFAGAIKQELRITMRMAGGRGLGPKTEPLGMAEGTRLHQDAEQERSYRFESLRLLGSPAAVDAARTWQHAVWDLYQYVATDDSATEDGYTALYDATGTARERFHTAARASVGLSGAVAAAPSPVQLEPASRRY